MIPGPRAWNARSSRAAEQPEAPMLLRIAVAVLLFVHGLVHLRVWWWGVPQSPFNPRRLWLIGETRAVSVALAVLAGALLMLAGAGYLTGQAWAAHTAIDGSLVSLVLIVLVFTLWF